MLVLACGKDVLLAAADLIWPNNGLFVVDSLESKFFWLFLFEKNGILVFFSGFHSGTHHCNGKATFGAAKKQKKDIYSQSSMAGCWSKGNMRSTEGFWLLGHLLNTSVWSHDPACAGWRAGRGAHKGYWLHLLSTCSPIGCQGSLFILIFISFFIDIVSSMPCF